jgi:hypothetical protein
MFWLSGDFCVLGAVASAHSARGWALRGQDGGVPEPHSHLLEHGFQMLAANRALKPAQWTVGPAGPARRVRMRPPLPIRPIRHPAGPPPVHGSGILHTGVCRMPQPYKPDQAVWGRYYCWCERGEPGAPAGDGSGFIGPARSVDGGSRMRRFQARQGWLVGSPDGCPVRTGGAADRASEPDRRLDREPPHGPVFTLGRWHWSPL